MKLIGLALTFNCFVLIPHFLLNDPVQPCLNDVLLHRIVVAHGAAHTHFGLGGPSSNNSGTGNASTIAAMDVAAAVAVPWSFDHWLPHVGIGFPLLAHYQHVPHLLAMAAVRFTDTIRHALWPTALPQPRTSSALVTAEVLGHAVVLDAMTFALLAIVSPLALYTALRTLFPDGTGTSAALVTMALPAVSDAPPPQQRQQADRFEYGLGWGHAMRGGHGLWSQTLAAALLWPAMALGIVAVGSSIRKTALHPCSLQWRLQLRREALAGVAVGLCVLSNMFVGVVAAASIVLFAITPAPNACCPTAGDDGSALLPSLLVRLRRLSLVALFALITSSYWLVPFIDAGAAGAVWPLEPRPWKVYGVGARAVLSDAFRGRLLDHREGDVHALKNGLGAAQDFLLSLAALPVVTVASAAGVYVAARNLLRWHHCQRAVDARRAHLDLWLLSGILLWSVAYSGRPLFEWVAGFLFGPAAPSVLRRWWDTMPLLGQLHLHRLVLGLQAFGLMLAARSVEALLTWAQKSHVLHQQSRSARKRAPLLLVLILVIALCPSLVWRWRIAREHAAKPPRESSEAAQDSWIAKSLVAIIRHRHATFEGRAGVGRVFAGTRASVEEGSWFVGHGIHAALQEAGATPSTAASVDFAHTAAHDGGNPHSVPSTDNFTDLPVPVLVPGALLHGLSPAAAVLNSFDWRRADHLRLFNVRYVVAPRNHSNTSSVAQQLQQSLATAVDDGWLCEVALPPALRQSVRLLELNMSSSFFRTSVECDDEASGTLSQHIDSNGAGYFMLGAASPMPRGVFRSAAMMRRSAAAEGQIGAGQLAVKAQVAWRRALRWAGDFGTWVLENAVSGTGTGGSGRGALRKWAAARARFGLGLQNKQSAANRSTCFASAQSHGNCGHDVRQDVISTASMEAEAAAKAAALVVGGALDEHGVAWDGAAKKDTDAAHPCATVEGAEVDLQKNEAPAMLAPSQLLELSEAWLSGMGPLAAHFVRYVPPASSLSLIVNHHSTTFCQQPPLPPPPLPSCLMASLLAEQEAAATNVAHARQHAALEHDRAVERETTRQLAVSGGSVLSRSSQGGCVISYGDLQLKCALADFSAPLKTLLAAIKLALRVPSAATKSAEREPDTKLHVWQGCEKYKITASRLPFALLVRRGGCSFDQKARVALAMGAHAMIVVNNPSSNGVGEPIPMGGSLDASALQCNVSAGISFTSATDVMAVPLASQPDSLLRQDECCRACINAAAIAAADGGNGSSSCNVWTIFEGTCYLKHQPIGTAVAQTTCDGCTSGQVQAVEVAPESPALTAVMVSSLDGNDLISSALHSGIQISVRIGEESTRESSENSKADGNDDLGNTRRKTHGLASAPVLTSIQAASASIAARGTVRAQWATPSASTFGCIVRGTGDVDSEADLVLKQAYHPRWRCWRSASMPPVSAQLQLLPVRAVLPGFVSVRVELPADTDVHVTCSYVPDERKWKLLLWSIGTLAICAAFTSESTLMRLMSSSVANE